MRSFAAFVALLSLASLGFAQPKPQGTLGVSKKSALDKPTFEQYIRHQFLIPANLKLAVADPKPSEVPGLLQMTVTVTDGGAMSQTVEFFVSKDGSKVLQGKVFDIGDSPFAADLKLLTTAGAPTMGPAEAPVTIAVFSDFQCQYCKEEAKTLRTNLEKAYPTQVRLVFKDMPIEQIHNWAKPASLIGRCIARQNPGVFWQYHDWIFEQQAQIKAEELQAKALDFANGKGLDSLQLTQCVTGKLTAKEVEDSIVEARALQVGSTPTLFINGRRMVGSVPWEQLKPVIDHELGHARKTAAAKKDEPCCEVRLAIPTAK
jgi:protein-disulfide isomerase